MSSLFSSTKSGYSGTIFRLTVYISRNNLALKTPASSSRYLNYFFMISLSSLYYFTLSNSPSSRVIVKHFSIIVDSKSFIFTFYSWMSYDLSVSYALRDCISSSWLMIFWVNLVTSLLLFSLSMLFYSFWSTKSLIYYWRFTDSCIIAFSFALSSPISYSFRATYSLSSSATLGWVSATFVAATYISVVWAFDCSCTLLLLLLLTMDSLSLA